jgi:hypothetical protein
VKSIWIVEDSGIKSKKTNVDKMIESCRELQSQQNFPKKKSHFECVKSTNEQHFLIEEKK